ncbi:hypothetical protein EFO90_09940 [Lactiplantibacillus plantarum]|uniref:hypothetical protein n=1 Tax=Lactiplantibacillus plantarum TaxID=1590 RepID=UPI0021A75739|nr:hypothetical protein [Lactiplantibacillus plantarum]MCT3214674.1 hypothetical protein [Lactiplantibacillus plantarum]MCT3272328.1 hypothetical protein [Lactiplantibacillus plantarum]
MKMIKFNEIMQKLGLNYTAMTCFDLDTAAMLGKKAQSWDRKAQAATQPLVAENFKAEANAYWRKMEVAQHNALAGAMQEKDTGPIFETWIDEYSLTDLTTINQIIQKWAPILRKYGVELQTY